mmetsp:Transcript_45524/g.90189  ORF Transcript_45524/g.90189 Transcript_45524/m.90189 type:complete len:286 (+) Transcript_45524:93-950(+)|eukprot:CAMPEP_0172692928 /NCGR_PEP_ID=MMETSP1074-20121228/25614_1 /TAXON_ID=2916 /ORGANISM="Ceratium fusus, Strain PA161109" /LENGTH=285 /DNA_ID=CAMNT_0013513211 /DNA_START=72 /DNA_END=929 /DNA_ORIENTATION=-
MACMTQLPVDLVFVRHGESEGNIYDKMGPCEAREKLHSKYTSQYRLTDLGRVQSTRAGKILQERLGKFDKMFVSEYTRAVETAGYMDLPESSYRTETLIRELDNATGKRTGESAGSPMKDLDAKSAHVAGKWWHRPAGGENFADLCMRLQMFLETLRVEAAGLRVCIVCHGHVMRGFKALLESYTEPNFEALLQSENPNCLILWYTRRDALGVVHSRLHRCITIKMEDPNDAQRTDAACKVEEASISRPFFSAADLRARAANIPQILNTADAAGKLKSKLGETDP